MDVVVNDSVTREAISRAEERKFLRFVKEDPHFCRYYEGIYILFKTGLRISEFCGLTISDIDFKEHTINIDHQLQKKSKIGYYIQETKTTELRELEKVSRCTIGKGMTLAERENKFIAESKQTSIFDFLGFPKINVNPNLFNRRKKLHNNEKTPE